MKRNCIPFLALLCALCIMLSSCYSSVQETTSSSDASTGVTTSKVPVSSEEPGVQIVANHTFSPDNLHGALSGIGGSFPVAGGFYKASSPITYYDIEHEAKIIMCNLAGCSHNTEDCPAFMPGITNLLATEDAVYTFCDSGGTVSLRKLNLNNYEKTTEWLQETKETRYYAVNDCFYSSGYIYFKYSEMTPKEAKTYTNIYNTETGEMSLLFADTKLTSFTVEGAYGNTVLTVWGEYDEAAMSWEEYRALHLDEDETTCINEYYDVYLTNFFQEHYTGGLRFYDLETMTYADAYPLLKGDSQETLNIYLSSDSICFGEYLLYTLGDAVMRYSLKTGERELLVEEEGIVNGSLLDGKLIYLTYVDSILKIHVYDIQTGSNLLVDNAGDTDAMVFGVYKETEDAFIGYDVYNGYGQSWILKEDFYNARYENAHKY